MEIGISFDYTKLFHELGSNFLMDIPMTQAINSFLRATEIIL